MGSVAFKEWAVICRNLAEGHQVLILRKGGIAESGGEFRPTHSRFLLEPTYFHEQHRTGIKPELLPILEAAERARPPAGILRLTHFAEVTALHHLTQLDQALALDPFHGWTAETVRQRFHYRTPGLFALIVRVFALPHAVDLIDRPEYAGCKTWVELDTSVSTEQATPVLTDEEFARTQQAIKSVIGAG